MLGAIIGDIVGSRFEFNNLKTEKFQLFTQECDFTDDSILTVAVADAILHDKSYSDSALEWCRKYPSPMGGYGGTFSYWVRTGVQRPYNSFGNGSAMRVSPVGFAFDTEAETIKQAIASAEFTHNHPEGIVGAVAVARAIFNLRMHKDLAFVSYLKDLYYPDNDGAPQGVFDETCQGTVPVAFNLLLASSSFENAIRRTMQWGGDSDTLGAIVGGMAEAYFGIPEGMAQHARTFLPGEMLAIIDEFYKSTKY